MNFSIVYFIYTFNFDFVRLEIIFNMWVDLVNMVIMFDNVPNPFDLFDMDLDLAVVVDVAVVIFFDNNFDFNFVVDEFFIILNY